MYGVDRTGLLYVHVRVFKQDRIFGEIFATGGVVRICCRDCLRWHKVTIRQPGQAVLVEDARPEYLG
jgi:hypothetical protein